MTLSAGIADSAHIAHGLYRSMDWYLSRMPFRSQVYQLKCLSQTLPVESRNPPRCQVNREAGQGGETNGGDFSL